VISKKILDAKRIMDKISNLIIGIKNAGDAKNEKVFIPYSNFKMEIVNLLQKEGFVGLVNKKNKKNEKMIEIEILYNEDKNPKIGGVKRVSKLSKRVYLGAKEIRFVRGGHGALVLSTPKGVMTGKQAKKEKVGGEALFEIW